MSDRGTHTVLVFSHSPRVREQIRFAVGRRPAPDVGRIEYIECAQDTDLISQVDAGGIDLLILDAEAQPTGGMGICRQLKSEKDHCPPVCLVIARRDDRWLASWSQADATITHPLDSVAAAEAVAGLLRARTGAHAG